MGRPSEVFRQRFVSTFGYLSEDLFPDRLVLFWMIPLIQTIIFPGGPLDHSLVPPHVAIIGPVEGGLDNRVSD